jgi:hypothetical protein
MGASSLETLAATQLESRTWNPSWSYFMWLTATIFSLNEQTTEQKKIVG